MREATDASRFIVLFECSLVLIARLPLRPRDAAEALEYVLVLSVPKGHCHAITRHHDHLPLPPRLSYVLFLPPCLKYIFVSNRCIEAPSRALATYRDDM